MTTTSIKDTFGHLLAVKRVQANLSEAQLAELMNEVSFTPLTSEDFAAWKRGKRCPDSSTLEVLIDTLLEGAPNKERTAALFRRSAEELEDLIANNDAKAIEDYIFDDKNIGQLIGAWKHVGGLTEERIIEIVNEQRHYEPVTAEDILDYQYNL